MNITKTLTLPTRDGIRAKAKNLLIDNIPDTQLDGQPLTDYVETHKSINNSQLAELTKKVKNQKIKKELLNYIDILETYANLDLFVAKRYNITSVYCRNCKSGKGSLNFVENKKRYQGNYDLAK